MVIASARACCDRQRAALDYCENCRSTLNAFCIVCQPRTNFWQKRTSNRRQPSIVGPVPYPLLPLDMNDLTDLQTPIARFPQCRLGPSLGPKIFTRREKGGAPSQLRHAALQNRTRWGVWLVPTTVALRAHTLPRPGGAFSSGAARGAA